MAMLPVVDPEVVAVDRSAVDPRRASLPPGVSVVPDVEAGEMPGAWPMLQFAADPGQSRAAWEGLAPLSWALSGRAKPGASALLVVDGDPVEEGRGVVVAAQPFGLGKVLWVGTDGTWRWRLRVGDAYHHRFWGQVVRWAAEGSTAEGNRLVRFGPDRPELPEGAPVPLRAEFSEEAPGISPDLIAAARIFEEGGGEVEDEGRGEPTPIALVPLHPSPDRPRTFEASAPALPSGRYRAVLDVPGLADAFEEAGLKPPEATFEVAPEETDELIELAADRLGLDRLASITGGRVLRDFEAGQLPRLIPPRAIEETRTAETPLWDTPVGLLAFFGLMGAEWVVRKRSGLP
jgi:hypothetical protein